MSAGIASSPEHVGLTVIPAACLSQEQLTVYPRQRERGSPAEPVQNWQVEDGRYTLRYAQPNTH